MRRILLSTVKILISAALLYLSLRKVNLYDLAARLHVESLGWIALAIAVLFLQIFVGVLRWREISSECGAPMQSIAAPVTFGQVFQLMPPVMLITMLPISIAGWGVREATMGLAFGYAGLMANEGVNMSLLFGAVSFLVGIFGGLMWIFSPEKAAQGEAPIEVPK